MRRLIGELVGPEVRTLPWRALVAGSLLGLLPVALSRLPGGEPGPWAALTLLRAAALGHALALAFLLDDPARHTTATVPVRRPLRIALRLALVTPVTALWWTAVVLLVPSSVRPPTGAVTLEAAATCALALAGAALAVRLADEPRPGPSVAAALLLTALLAVLLWPARWPLFASPGDPKWGEAHERWAWLLAAALLVLGACLPEPVRRRTWRRGRRPSLSPSGA
ncbi:ABC transporter [Streptomyces gilvifuscus]|uniref:ABC transporter n=1 Tax=Streptomyces gilvifuscus TaxID=1550617 RepID=A0ABT5G7M1_9ACTN|nr:ABC transporter [Streptomyces gilvifuscus]MDC2960587.1 ABC transporter [Streptomyces gilvifuscus]